MASGPAALSQCIPNLSRQCPGAGGAPNDKTSDGLVPVMDRRPKVQPENGLVPDAYESLSAHVIESFTE